MPDLATYQRRFVDALDGTRPWHPALSVYRNTALKGAIDALADNHPTVSTILGATAFLALAADFVADVPPQSPVLADYGAGFGDWLEAQPIAQVLPYISAVAQIDRLRVESHLAAEADVLDPRALTAISAEHWSASGAVLHPATRFAWFTVPAPSIWLAHIADGDDDIAPEWRAEGVLVTRRFGAVTAYAINAAEHRILFGLRLGETVGQAAAVAATLYPDADISAAFRKILAGGALSSLRNKGF